MKNIIFILTTGVIWSLFVSACTSAPKVQMNCREVVDLPDTWVCD